MSSKNETIVDRVVARLKAQPLGDLITEEDLHDIVKEAIPKTFFERRRLPNPNGGYGRDYIDADPLLFEIMRELLKEPAKEAVQQWAADNAALMAETWKTVIDEGLFRYIRKMEEEIAIAQIKTALRPMIELFNKDLQARGLAMIPTYF